MARQEAEVLNHLQGKALVGLDVGSTFSDHNYTLELFSLPSTKCGFWGNIFYGFKLLKQFLFFCSLGCIPWDPHPFHKVKVGFQPEALLIISFFIFRRKFKWGGNNLTCLLFIHLFGTPFVFGTCTPLKRLRNWKLNVPLPKFDHKKPHSKKI